MIRSRPSLLWPFLIIALGVLLLLQNLGLLPNGLWAALAQLWPVIFILIGLDMLLGRRPSGAAAVLLLGGLIVAGALVWAALRAGSLPPGATQDLFQFGHEAERLHVTLDFTAGELNVSALENTAYVMEGRAQHAADESLEQQYAVDGGVGRLRLKQITSPLLLPFLAGGQPAAHWDVGLTPSLPLTLEVSTGAGRTTLDLSGLSLTHLVLNTGVGETRVTLPGAGPITGQVRTGVGATVLVLPASLPARLTVNSGIANVVVPPRFSQDGTTYTTAGFDPNLPHLDLEVNAGLGQVVVE